jgi:hypothetical protein
VDWQPFLRKMTKYDEPKTLNEAINKAKYLYDQGQEENPCRNIGRKRRMRSMIRGGKDSNLSLIGMSLIEIVKISLIRGISKIP